MEPPRVDMEELHRQGFTVLRKMVPADVTARARNVMDRILGPPCREVADPLLGRVYEGEPAGLRGQYYAAAREGLRTGRAVVTSGAHRHGIRHPIFDPVSSRGLVAGGAKQSLLGAPRSRSSEHPPGHHVVDLIVLIEFLVRNYTFGC